MALKFGDRRWHDDATGTVTFPSFSGSTRVTCRITDEALKAVFGSGGSATDLVETFDRCRASIEAAAEKKFDTGGDGMKIVLVSTDFETRAPAKEEPKPQSAAEIAAMIRRHRAHSGGSAKSNDPSLLHPGNLAKVVAALKAAPLGEIASIAHEPGAAGKAGPAGGNLGKVLAALKAAPVGQAAGAATEAEPEDAAPAGNAPTEEGKPGSV